MTNFSIASAFLLAAAQTADPKPVDYSIRFFFDWHQQALRNAADWSVQNGYSLFSAAVCFVFTIAFCVGLLLLIRKILVPHVEKWNKNTAKGVMAVSGPVVWLVFWIGFSCSVDFIPFSVETHQAVDKLFYVCFGLVVLSIFQHVLQFVASLMIAQFKRRDPENYNMNKLLLDLSLSIVRLTVWLYAFIFILQEVFHFKVTHLIASAGILGLAVAFAAKDTISNIFGAFSILGCKMFQVGDCIKIGSTEGTVDQIGIRSIRIRAFEDGRMIDIPNHLIADSQIENFSRRLYWREHFCFGLTYQTTPEQMALAKKILSDIGNDLAELMVKNKPVQFDFLLFDQSSLNLDGFVWFKASHGVERRRYLRGLFNEEVLKRFAAAGLDFAFPTTTVIVENTEKK